AELARVQLEGESLGEVALLRLQHLDLDHLGRADVLTEATADAVLLPRLLVVGQREDAAVAVGIHALDRPVVHGDRPADQIDQRRLHRAARGRAELDQLAPETFAGRPTHRGLRGARRRAPWP